MQAMEIAAEPNVYQYAIKADEYRTSGTRRTKYDEENKKASNSILTRINFDRRFIT